MKIVISVGNGKEAGTGVDGTGHGQMKTDVVPDFGSAVGCREIWHPICLVFGQMTLSDEPPPGTETARMGEEFGQQALETDDEYVKRLLIALSDVRQRAQTLSEELTQAMRHLGVPLPPDKES